MSTADIGLIGLAVMGSNLALNIAEKGYTIAVHNRTAAKIDEFVATAKAAGARRQDRSRSRSRRVRPGGEAPALDHHHGQGRQAGRRHDRAIAAASGTGRRHHRVRQFAVHRYPAPLRLSDAQGHRLSRRRRFGRRRRRAPWPLDHGRRLQGAVAQCRGGADRHRRQVQWRKLLRLSGRRRRRPFRQDHP